MNLCSRLPLTGIRIADMSDGKGEMCGRYLADLGAEVIFIEPRTGAKSRRADPMLGDLSLYFATHNANKQGLALDIQTTTDRQSLLDLLGVCDIFIETTKPGTLEPLGLNGPALLARYPRLIVISITDFGQTGPYRDYEGTGAIHLALGGGLCRSGLPRMPPVLPPTQLAYEATAIQAALCACLAYWNRLLTGLGDYLDFSTFEATAQILDPGIGVAGVATPAAKGPGATRGRPDMRYLYPIFPCADGHVRLCVLSPRQWHGMRTWLGEPEEFMDPGYDRMAVRYDARDRLYPLIGKLFANRPAAELIAEGQQLGVPIAVVGTSADVLRDEHFKARNSFIELEVNGVQGKMPSGFIEINGERASVHRPAPRIGEYNRRILARIGQLAAETVGQRPVLPPEAPKRRPLDGIRVLDLGVIVVGAEVGRLLSDQGAEVIKIENSAYPDGLRHTLTGNLMSPAFAAGHRGKLSLGLNLRSPEGKSLFKELVAKADIVLSNFKPGTLESLGLDYRELVKVNPRIIMADSSALGSWGPKSRSMGYGPLVRAETGFTRLWSYPDIDDGFSDASTIFPDNFAARVVAVGALSLLIRRERAGVGGTASVAQAEVILNAFAAQFLRESVQPGSFAPQGNASEFSAPHGVYECLGDDEWCVITVRDDFEWSALCAAMGNPSLAAEAAYATAADRIANHHQLDQLISGWTRKHAPRDVMQTLQATGVPAGAMLRIDDYETDPHFLARTFVRRLDQPGLPVPIPTENGPCKAMNLPDPDIRPAPMMGQHTLEIAANLLELPPERIQAYLEAGIFEAPD